jgi:hypothetical protein
MPHTLHALDTLIARLLRTETLIAVLVISMQALDGFSSDTEIIGGSVIAVAFAIGRSLVKASGYRDMPGGDAVTQPTTDHSGASTMTD